MKNKLTIYYMFFNYIDFNYFIISLTIGLFFVYIIGPEQPVILVYPTPDNQEKYQYVDKDSRVYDSKGFKKLFGFQFSSLMVLALNEFTRAKPFNYYSNFGKTSIIC